MSSGEATPDEFWRIAQTLRNDHGRFLDTDAFTRTVSNPIRGFCKAERSTVVRNGRTYERFKPDHRCHSCQEKQQPAQSSLDSHVEVGEMTPVLITLEEHYLSAHIQDEATSGKHDPYSQVPQAALDQLLSLGESRIQHMDAGGVKLQVISHAASEGSREAIRSANDQLAAACRANPTRFAGFAKLPMAEPYAAADELARCVREHGFVGALINNHSNGKFYDEEKFWPVFACAEELDVPLYLHPTFVAEDLAPHYKGNFSDVAAFSMGTSGWGAHSETGLHFLRLWASGLFDRHPKLKIVLGHMGEMLPYYLDRVVASSSGWSNVDRDLRTVWKENVWVTTSGMFSLAPLACLLKVCSIDRIMYSVDYPAGNNETGLAFIQEIEAQGILSKEDLDSVCWANAVKLLKLKLDAN